MKFYKVKYNKWFSVGLEEIVFAESVEAAKELVMKDSKANEIVGVVEMDEAEVGILDLSVKDFKLLMREVMANEI